VTIIPSDEIINPEPALKAPKIPSLSLIILTTAGDTHATASATKFLDKAAVGLEFDDETGQALLLSILSDDITFFLDFSITQPKSKRIPVKIIVGDIGLELLFSSDSSFFDFSLSSVEDNRSLLFNIANGWSLFGLKLLFDEDGLQ
jgi:hypothetical protein